MVCTIYIYSGRASGKTSRFSSVLFIFSAHSLSSHFSGRAFALTMSTTMKIIAATAGLVLVVVALVLGIVGVATNSWAEASAGEIKFHLDLWKMCVKLPQLDAFNCSAIASTCKITSDPGPGSRLLFHRNQRRTGVL